MINEVEMTNWKTHGKTTLSFAKGTNIIIGHMGAGKSSVVDAISFGLYGTSSAIKSRRIGVEELIRNRPDQKSSSSIRICFSSGSDAYVVEREITLNGPGKATLQKNGVYMQSQPKRVTEEVEKVLKMDYDLFSRAVYSEQNRLDYFLELNPGERKRIIDNMLGLDRFVSANENVVRIGSRLREMAGESRKLIEGMDIEGKKKQVKEVGAELQSLELQTETARREIDALGKEVLLLQDKLRKAKGEVARKTALSGETTVIRSRISVMQREIEEIEKDNRLTIEEIGAVMEDAEKKHAELRKSSEAAMRKLQNAQIMKGKADEAISTLSKNIAERNGIVERVRGMDPNAMETEAARLKREQDATESELAALKAQRNEALKWAAELEKHFGKCPLCESELGEKKRQELISSRKSLVAGFDKAAEELRKRGEAAREALLKMTKQINTWEVSSERLKAYGNLEERMRAAESDCSACEAESLSARKDADALSIKISESTAQLEKLKASKNAITRKMAYSREIEKLNAEMLLKEKEISEIAADDAVLDILQKEFTRISSEVSGRRAALESSERSIKERSRQLAEKKAELERLAKLEEDLRTKEKAIENMNRLGDALRETQSHLRQRLIGAVNEVMLEIWPELYPYRDYAAVRLSAEEEDYVLMVSTQRNGKESWEAVNAVASGGERSIACLAMRVAFALVLVPNLKWLILDEPTHNIDRQGIGKFIEVFNEKLPSIIEQVFIITHDEQLRQVSNAKVYLLGRNKEAAEETRVERL